MGRVQNTRVLEQALRALADLRRSMRNEATRIKAAAQAASPVALAHLQEICQLDAAAFLVPINQIDGRLADPDKKARLVEALGRWGMALSDVSGEYTDIKSAAQQFQGADFSSYATIIAACDALLASVAPGDSLWPE